MRIGLISDTHGKLRAEVFPHFEGVELILHAGDIGDVDILTELEAIAPVRAVVGNTDGSQLSERLPEVDEMEFLGHRIVLTHGHLIGSPTPALLRQRHPDAHIIVYGHTHMPAVDRAPRSLVINPGAAGPARFKLKPSVAILELSENSADVRIVEL